MVEMLTKHISKTILLIAAATAVTITGLSTTEHILALGPNEQLNNNINNQHVLGNAPINGGPPQSTFGYFFSHSH